MFDNIPFEMKQFCSWIVWRYEHTDLIGGKPTKVPYNPLTGTLAEVNVRSSWATFEQAVHALTSTNWYSGLGFVLSNDDPYTFIDLDGPADKENFERQQKIFNSCDSYAELSPSGHGLHIIIRAKVPSGRKRSQIEIYSDLRYMTMTGNVFRNSMITENEELANALWSELGKGKNKIQYYFGTAEEQFTDEEIIQRAYAAENGMLFKDLWEGNWEYRYKSQSEADFALVDILAFYSQNNKQVVRLFQSSALGQRKKGKRVGYINYMLNRCYDNMLPPVDVEGLQNALSDAISTQKQRQEAERNVIKSENSNVQVIDNENDEIYSVPPGLVGEIAQYIYAQSNRPVAEIALAAALALMAGIVGRCYKVNRSGLNLYILLLAKTGRGKEGMARGIDRLMGAVENLVPNAREFIGPGEIASEPAIIKYMASGKRSLLCVLGEYGVKMKEMCSKYARPEKEGVKRFLLQAYHKSDIGSVMHPIIYSDKDKNTTSILSPAFSILAESNPNKFYESLDDSLITEGFLPRFTVIEYLGKRVPENDNEVSPPDELVAKLATLCSNCLTLNDQDNYIELKYHENAYQTLRSFGRRCDQFINSGENPIVEELWNRAEIKALRLSALVAVGVDPYNPVIDLSMANWAIRIVENEIKNFALKFSKGEIGSDSDECRQLSKMIECMSEYILSPYERIQGYTERPDLHYAHIIPYSYIQRRIGNIAVFKRDRLGSKYALKRAIDTLLERGDVQKVSPALTNGQYNTTAACYMIANPSIFGIG